MKAVLRKSKVLGHGSRARRGIMDFCVAIGGGSGEVHLSSAGNRSHGEHRMGKRQNKKYSAGLFCRVSGIESSTPSANHPNGIGITSSVPDLPRIFPKGKTPEVNCSVCMRPVKEVLSRRGACRECAELARLAGMGWKHNSWLPCQTRKSADMILWAACFMGNKNSRRIGEKRGTMLNHEH